MIQVDDADAVVARYDTRSSVIDINGDAFTIVHPRDAEELIDEAAFNRDERLPYWADIWPSSVALARAVRAMRGGGRTLLELGCGVGLVSAAAVRAGFDVLATDYYDDALAFARVNALANTGQDVRTMHVDWRSLPPGLARAPFIVAADVLYERAYGALVASVIGTLLAPGGSAWIADPGRVGSPAFFEVLRPTGLRHVGATVSKVALHGREHSITVHEVCR